MVDDVMLLRELLYAHEYDHIIIISSIIVLLPVLLFIAIMLQSYIEKRKNK